MCRVCLVRVLKVGGERRRQRALSRVSTRPRRGEATRRSLASGRSGGLPPTRQHRFACQKCFRKTQRASKRSLESFLKPSVFGRDRLSSGESRGDRRDASFELSRSCKLVSETTCLKSWNGILNRTCTWDAGRRQSEGLRVPHQTREAFPPLVLDLRGGGSLRMPPRFFFFSQPPS